MVVLAKAKNESACNISWDFNLLYRNLYWADAQLKRLEVALLDGRYRKHLIKTDLHEPNSVAVNPRLGWD